MPYPTPDHEGWFWAKLVHPRRMPEGEDWKSVDWEVVQVDRNSLGGLCEADREAGEEEFSALVVGVTPSQSLQDFVWGPEVPPLRNVGSQTRKARAAE